LLDVVVICDMPADIACSCASGAHSFAFATGRYSVEELARHSPTAVFESLADTAAVMRVILHA
jgi:phosphoglycolate phosphatase-like HAD superfamily hydrolase